MFRRVLTAPAAVLLIALMALGSIAMWVAVPVGWLWVASRLQHDSQPGLTPYVVVLAGIPVSMFVIGKLLARLDRAYGRLTGTTPTVRVQAAWLRSMRGERVSRRPRSVLDVVMVVSVAIALVVFGVWFFGFAGSSLPS